MRNKIKQLFKLLGPGFITGASDDDPSGIATYAQTGALFGYSQLWTAVFSFPFMTAIQEMCGRIGMVTGKGLAGVLKHHYPKWVVYTAVFLLFIANTINIGADLGAMAASAQLLFGVPFYYLLIGMTLLTISLEVLVPYKIYSNFLKFLAFSLFAYVISAFVIKQDWQKVFVSVLVPNILFTKDYVFNIVAIFGTTFSPYLFFWQASEEIEEEVVKHEIRDMDVGKPKINSQDLVDMRSDTTAGMFFSNLVMFFIIVTAASTFGAAGITKIETAAQAAEALKPLAGDFAYVLFAAGIIGTGLLAVPILAGSVSYAVSELFNWKLGLGKKFNRAPLFYGIIILSTLVGFFVNFTSIKPFQMLYYTAVVNGICAPILMFMILLISNNKKILGEYTNSKLSNFLGLIISTIMLVSAVILLGFL